jgi:hypothetical protein
MMSLGGIDINVSKLVQDLIHAWRTGTTFSNEASTMCGFSVAWSDRWTRRIPCTARFSW